MLNRSIGAVVCLGLAATLAACEVAPRRDERIAYAPAPVVAAEYGKVENIGIVALAARPTGGGAVLGAVLGAVIGSRFGGGTGQVVAAGAGAVGGAIAGNAIESRSKRDDEVYRVQVRFDNGYTRDFDFKTIDDLRVGDRVKYEGGQVHRL